MEYDNARVLIADQKLETIKEVLPLLEQLTRINAPLLIIAEDVTGAIRGLLVVVSKPFAASRWFRGDVRAKPMACNGPTIASSTCQVLQCTCAGGCMMQRFSATHDLVC